MNTQPAIWLVWNPQGNTPKHPHQSKHRAELEAERLARENPGQRFIVLQSISERMVDGMQRIEHRADDEPPF